MTSHLKNKCSFYQNALLDQKNITLLKIFKFGFKIYLKIPKIRFSIIAILKKRE